MYVGWAYIGKIITGTYVYFFFNFQEIGWEYALLSVGSFVGLTNICDFPKYPCLSSMSLIYVVFAVTYGITGFRELVTRKCEDKSAGYIRLPQ